MAKRTWFITGVSGGLAVTSLISSSSAAYVVGTVRDASKAADLRERFLKRF